MSRTLAAMVALEEKDNLDLLVKHLWDRLWMKQAQHARESGMQPGSEFHATMKVAWEKMGDDVVAYLKVALENRGRTEGL